MNFRRVALMVALIASINAHALYDPAPIVDIAAAQGEWHGKLTYDDYSQPGKLVTLPTQLFVAMESPSKLVLQYIFDDGPHKTVYSYETMDFDLQKNEVRWQSGVSKRTEFVAKIISNTLDNSTRHIVFEHKTEKGIERYSMDLSVTAFALKKEEIQNGAAPHFRDKYEFQRVGR